MKQRPEVLVLDDGNLHDVCAVLEELRANFSCVLATDLSGFELEQPTRLLVASGPHALALPAGGNPCPAPVRIAVVDQDAPGLSRPLRARGFDFLVRRPVHATALRLLLRNLLARSERRADPRIHLGTEVACQTDRRDRPAWLLDLSSRGCALEAAWAEEPDTPILVRLPKALVGDDATLNLPGWVLRCDATFGDEPTFHLAVVFAELTAESERRLAALLAAAPE